MLGNKNIRVSQLREYVTNQIWILEYPVRFMGMDLFARMTIIKLETGELIVHDPCKIDAAIKNQIDALGVVKFIIAPGNFHHLFVADFQEKYPDAETYLCPGLERKRPELKFDWILANKPDPRWNGALDLIVIQGTRIIWEVAIFHRPSKTLILVDLVENIGDDYRHEAGWLLQFWWRYVFRMWNTPKPAPEYQVGWGNKSIVKKGLNKILDWHAERLILAHGENIETNVNDVLELAWKKVLNA